MVESCINLKYCLRQAFPYTSNINDKIYDTARP